MPVSFTLPTFEGKPVSVRDKVFTVLTLKFPLSLIEILNEVKKQYNVSVSFQGVRKAVLELVQARVLVQDGKKFAINTQWILNLTKYAGMLQRQYFTSPGNKTKTKVEVGSNVVVYTFSRLLDMDFVWNSIIREHFASKPDPPKFITFEAAHFWWVVVTLAQETELMKELIGQGIELHWICWGQSPLDRWTVKHYNDIGVRCTQQPMPKDLALGYNVGTYGNLVLYTTYPKEIARKIDVFFKKYKKIEDASLDEIFKIANEQMNVTLTVLNDPILAKTLREGLMKRWS